MAAAAVLGSCAVYAGGKHIHNDAKNKVDGAKAKQDPTLAPATGVKDEDSLHSLVWGSNRCVDNAYTRVDTHRTLELEFSRQPRSSKT